MQEALLQERDSETSDSLQSKGDSWGTEPAAPPASREAWNLLSFPLLGQPHWWVRLWLLAISLLSQPKVPEMPPPSLRV